MVTPILTKAMITHSKKSKNTLADIVLGWYLKLKEENGNGIEY